MQHMRVPELSLVRLGALKLTSS